MQLQQIKRARVGEQVLSQLRSMIEAGTWAEGEKIPSERELANTFGVSISTVRQALQHLNAIGLVETRVGTGSYIKSTTTDSSLDILFSTSHLSPKSWREVLEFREMLEDYAVELAVVRATEADLAFLEQNYQNMVSSQTPTDYATYDAQFHSYIGKMSRNSMIIKSYEMLEELLMRIITDEIDHVGIRGAEFHKGMIVAMQNRDQTQAKHCMRAHLRGLRRAAHLDFTPSQYTTQ